MPTFSQARANVKNIPVQAVNAPGVPSTAAGQAITAFGEIGGAARKGQVTADLQSEAEDLSLAFNALNAKETVVTPDGVDISEADPDGLIDTSTEGFRRLSLKREQGILSENQVALEGEVLLRQAITRAPGFEPELRRIAADAVGFDVTGAATRTFFGLGRVSSRAKTPLEIATLEAEKFVELLPEVSMETALRVIAKSEFGALTKALNDQDLASNRITANQYGQEEGANFESDAMTMIGLARGPNGEIADFDALSFELQKKHREYQNRAFLNTNKNGRIDNAARSDITEILKESLDGVLAIAESADALKILARNADAAVNSITLDSNTMFRGFAMVKATVGDRALEQMLRFLRISQNNPETIANFRRDNPGFDAAMKIMEAVEQKSLAELIVEVYLGNVGNVPPERLAELQAAAQIIAEQGYKDRDEGDASAGVGTQFDTGMSRMPMSQAARRPNGYSLLDEKTQGKFLAKWQPTLIQTQTQITSQLKAASQGILYNIDTERFEVVRDNPISPFLPQHRPRGGPGFQSPLAARDEVMFLNEVMLGVQKNDPKFMVDSGIDDYNVWGLAVANAINDGIVTLPAPAVLRGPDNQELEVITPGVFKDDQGNIFRVTEDGAFDQVGGVIDRESIPAKNLMPKFAAKHKKIVDMIIEASEARGIDPRLMVAMAKVESSFNPKAANNPNNPGVAEAPFSSAQGLFQNTIANFKDFGPDGGDRTDPEDSIEAGLNFMEFLQLRFPNDLEKQIVRWHGGQNSRLTTQTDIDFADKVLKELGISGN